MLRKKNIGIQTGNLKRTKWPNNSKTKILFRN